MVKIQYFKILKDRRDYKGERFFKVAWDSDTVIQVCKNSGEDNRKGKCVHIGVYAMTKQSFLSNYANYYTEVCSKKEFDTNFDRIVKLLK